MNESKPGATAPPDDSASALSSLTSAVEPNNNNNNNPETSNINPKGTMNMTTTTNTTPAATTLVEGATVTGVVESKNQHGASVNIDGTSAFLPVGLLGDTSLSDLAKGTEIAVNVVDTSGAKPRVAIADTAPAATTEVTEVTEVNAEVVTETAQAETEVETGADDLQDSIASLAAKWGASVKFESGSRKPSSKPGKPKAARVVEAPVAKVVTETAPAVEEKTVAVVEPETAPVVEVSEPVSEKAAFFGTVKVGDELTATVKFKKDFGVHLVVGKLGFGLLHVSEMPGTTMEDRKAFLTGLKYKQELKVRVIKVDAAANRLGFSMVADEKAEFFASLKVGTVVEGTVSGTKEIGAFINLGKTVGFLHVSEVDGKSREVRDAKLAGFKRGDKLELVVVDVNRDKQEVRLSQRRLSLATLTPGASVTGTFSSVRGNTIVVDLEVGGRGLLAKKGSKRYEYGETIVASVKSVNVAQGTVELV
ncbi:MAG: S1 RNA-binding domain-containing protein [Candidatus Melainabacteria bacterium]|nr:MAG: S1 RNA-binding domain-containing protein [Candidatus Melainabacteria bacterium]